MLFQGLFSPILIDFGKACLVTETRKKTLTEEVKARYYQEDCHISPEVIEGSHVQSVLSDMYSFGVLIASEVYQVSPIKRTCKTLS